MKRTTLLLTAVAALAGLAAAAKDVYVIDSNGTKIEGRALKADDRGNLTLQIAQGAQRTFKRGSYRYAHVPRPTDVARLEQALRQERYDIIKKMAPKIFDEYKYLGWAGRIAYIEAQAHLQDENYQRALNVAQEAAPFAGPQSEMVNRVKAEALLGLGRNDQAADILEGLRKSDDDATAAFAFYAQGQLAEEEGRKREAILEYLKTVLLFEPGSLDSQVRQRAKQQVVDLLKEMNDPRYKTFQQMK